MGEARDNALHHIVQVARTREGGEADLLSAPTQRLARTDHVEVDVGDDATALLRMLGEVFILDIDFAGPPEADIAPGAGKTPAVNHCSKGARNFKEIGAPAAVVVGEGVSLLQVRRQNNGLIVQGRAADNAFDEPLSPRRRHRRINL